MFCPIGRRIPLNQCYVYWAYLCRLVCRVLLVVLGVLPVVLQEMSVIAAHIFWRRTDVFLCVAGHTMKILMARFAISVIHSVIFVLDLWQLPVWDVRTEEFV
jgi:hypothetical protein